MDSNVSDEERIVALNFCNKHLVGAWRCVTLDQLAVNAVRCTLGDDVELKGTEPRQVLLRIYGLTKCNIEVQVSIFNQLAKAGLGPNLYSSFDEGRFEEYLPSSPLTWNQLTDDSISKVVTQKIAATHRLSVHELDKRAQWLLENYREMSEFVELARQNGTDLGFRQDTLESTRVLAHQMMAVDFEQEIEFLSKLIEKSNVPLVFSHNDIHQNNVILLHDANRSLSDRVILIDFEYCSYNYPTFDLANYMSEWCFDYNGDDYPNFSFTLERLPSREKQRQILAHYVDCLDSRLRNELFGSSLSRSDLIEQLLVEIQPMLMASNLLWSIWAVRSALTSKIKFGYWEMARSKWDVYMFCKRKFQEDEMNGNAFGGDRRGIRLQSSRM